MDKKAVRRRHYRWLTLEFLFYYAVLAYFFLRAFPNAMRVMRRRCVDSPQCRRHFRQGWLPVGYDALPVPGRKQRQGKAGRGGGGGGGWGALHFLAANDLADDQWRDFRGALPLLVAGALAHALVVLSVKPIGSVEAERCEQR